MSANSGSPATRSILVASLLANAILLLAMGAWVWRKGGVRYIGEQFGIIPTVHAAERWQIDWRVHNEALPNLPAEIIFLGDSITASNPWGEFFSRIRNRGIGGDTSSGVLQRLGEITESEPEQVFLNIGTVDLSKETPRKQVVENIVAIVRGIKEVSPSTQVYVCSILPINLDVEDNVRLSKKQRDIPFINRALAELQSETGFTFIDLTTAFSDAAGYLKREWTTDGTHLNSAGRREYCNFLLPYVSTDAAQLLAEQQAED